MTYSTGSGDYNAMMAAVLSHALTDGWLEDGGLGTGWPIKNAAGTMFTDWATSTFSADDFTLGGDGIPKTQRNIDFGMGTTAALSTTNAGSTVTTTPNAGYASLNYHIFSEPAVSEHVMCAYIFSNGVDAEVCGHFGFGDLDHAGMTHGIVQFCGAQEGKGWAQTNGQTSNAGNWNSINRTGMAYAGSIGETDDGTSNLQLIINNTSHPIPGTPGTAWPNTDTWLTAASAQTWKMSRPGTDFDVPWVSTRNMTLNFFPTASTPMPSSGSCSLMPLPIFIMNGSGTGGTMFLAGFIPSIRLASMVGFSVGDEISFAGDTWKIFPMLKKTPNSQLNDQFIVTSGPCAYAYKKVA